MMGREKSVLIIQIMMTTKKRRLLENIRLAFEIFTKKQTKLSFNCPRLFFGPMKQIQKKKIF